MGLEPQKKHSIFTTTMRRGGLASWALALALVACGGKSKPVDQPVLPEEGAGAGSAEVAPEPVAVPDEDIDSKDILARPEAAQEVEVKHVLLAWKDLAASYGGQMDPRAAQRTNAQAAKLAREIADQLRAKPEDIDALIKQHSEDPGSLTGETYKVASDSPFVPEFKSLALRLQEKEIGVVRTRFGYHVIERMPPTPPDPLESSDIMARTAAATEVHVRHVLIGWKDMPISRARQVDPRAAARTKADADKVATDTLAKLKKNANILKLMKDLSEDPGSAESGRSYTVDESSPFVAPFKKLALRLKLNESGLVKTDFGWHVIKRVPPPPPDKLESRAILGRKETAPSVTVKHILVGWKELSSGDPRGATRTRAELEELVKKTLAALKKGEPIEPMMKEHSEDPGSSESGQAYVVTPDASLVKPFKDLSLRLKMNEAGVVKTVFGLHIIQRVTDDQPAPAPAPAAEPPPASN